MKQNDENRSGNTDDHGHPAWVEELVDLVAGCMEAHSPAGPLGYWYSNEGDLWVLAVYPTPVEIVGGAYDGELVTPGFNLDLEELRSSFERITDLGWSSQALSDADAPYVWIEGVYLGNQVFMQILSYPPESEEPGLKLDTTQGPG